MTSLLHKSVLLGEVIQGLDLKNGLTVIDCTLGLGGHSEKILEKITPKGFLHGFEWDKDNAEQAEKRLKKYAKNCKIHKKNFVHIEETGKADRILFDLGISSVHLDQADKGFSFKKEAPLDMRMSKETKLTAYEIINTFPEEKLLRILWDYGEEKEARKIVRKILEQRKIKKIETTTELADLIANTKHKGRWGGGHPATQTFQALRIAVNNELENIEIALKKALEILTKNGIIAVISFHSLEDRIVKNIFKEASKPCKCSPEILQCTCKQEYKLLSKKPIIPSAEEIEENPRSRSAKLRLIQKLI